VRPNPKRRVPDLAARPLSAAALSSLIERRPHLLRPLAAQLLPPPLAPTDPGMHLAIDLSRLRTAEDVRQMLAAVLAAVTRGEVAPAEGTRIARRMRAPFRAVRHLARAERVKSGDSPAAQTTITACAVFD
jgi:hypothetical protein